MEDYKVEKQRMLSRVFVVQLTLNFRQKQQRNRCLVTVRGENWTKQNWNCSSSSARSCWTDEMLWNKQKQVEKLRLLNREIALLNLIIKRCRFYRAQLIFSLIGPISGHKIGLDFVSGNQTRFMIASYLAWLFFLTNIFDRIEFCTFYLIILNWLLHKILKKNKIFICSSRD